MDKLTESKCLELVENYRVLSEGNKWEFTEMVLACAEGYLDYSSGQVLNADGGFELRRL